MLLIHSDKEGLLPFVERSSGGMHMFKEEDFEWLQIIGCLKKAGMKFCDIKSFIELAMLGDSTINDRLQLIVAQKERVEEEIKELNKTLLTLKFKEWYYINALKDGTTKNVRNMSSEELPLEFREVHKRLKGN